MHARRLQTGLLMVGASSVESLAAQRGGELPVLAEHVQRPGGPPEALLGSLLWAALWCSRDDLTSVASRPLGALSPQEDRLWFDGLKSWGAGSGS